MSPRRARLTRRALLALLVVLGTAFAPGARTRAEDPSAEVAEAVRQLGPRGILWGRLAVEEESPDGPWTPLNGVEVHVYPAAPTLLAELERIRQSARDSGRQYETAVARLRAALAAHQAQGEAPAAGAVAPEGPAARTTNRRVTDPAGLFVFEDLPSADWLLVAIRVTPYGSAAARPAPGRREPARERRFVPKSGEAAREAEVWVTRVHVAPGERVSIVLTDRARWLVGPLR